MCGDGAGGEPHGGVCARGGSFYCCPTIPAVPARCMDTLRSDRELGLGRGEGQVSGREPARLGAAWSRDAWPLWKGGGRGAGWLRCPSSSVGLLGRLGGHCWPRVCWAVGATGTVFVWNMDEAPFIKLEFWEMTHGLASYTS